MTARRLVVLPLALAGCLLAGCGTSFGGFRSFGRAIFTGTSFADLELHGVARGCVPITGALAASASNDPRVAVAGQLLSLLGQDPLGCVLLVEPIGGIGAPFYVLCDGKLTATCAAIPGNQPVVVSGQPIGPGGILRATHVARDD